MYSRDSLEKNVLYLRLSIKPSWFEEYRLLKLKIYCFNKKNWQMSLWGATVITSLARAIPVVGNYIVSWLWGG
jgi:hypothetical protein